MLINERIEEPYNKNPDDAPLQILSKTLVKSKLTLKFWESVKHIYNSTLIENKENKNNSNSPKKTKKQKDRKNINNKNMNNINIKNYQSNNNINDINNNINKKNNIINKRVKTPKMIKRSFSAIETNKTKNNFFKNNDAFIKITVDNKSENELKFLRETAIKLEKELNINEEIIEAQNEENKALKNKIMKLTEILKTLVK